MLPTELQREAGELRKRMKFDDAERESKNYTCPLFFRLFFFSAECSTLALSG